MIIKLLISVAGWLVLVYLSTNLLGLFVRGLFSNQEMDDLRRDGSEFIKKEIEKGDRADKWINVIALILILIYLYSLLHFWNIGVVIAAVMLMASRLPDLLWEIKHGKKLSYTEAKALPKDALFFITTFLTFGALPVLWYALNYI